MPYAFTATIPAGVPSPPAPTVTAVTGLPPGLTVAGLTISGTPAWNEFGQWSVRASGTVPAASRFSLYKSWRGSGTIAISAPAPTITATPAAGFTWAGTAQLSLPVDITVTPGCDYVITATFAANPGAALSFDPAPPWTTALDGTIQVKISDANDRPKNTSAKLLITSVAPGGPTATLLIPIVKH